MYAMSARDWCGSYRRTLQTTLHGWNYIHAVAAATKMPVIHNGESYFLSITITITISVRQKGF